MPTNDDEYDQYALLDFIEFFAQNIEDISERWNNERYRNYQTIDCLNTSDIFENFQDAINEIFIESGLLYELTDEKIIERLEQNDVKLVEIQRSRGYSHRQSLSIAKIERIISKIREVNKDVIIMVDNCYGELVEDKEPGHVGADVVVGSLMKNLGGGIAPTGGYVAGQSQYIQMVAERLTAPGIGKDLGANFNLNNAFFKGLFMAPNAVKNALKTAVFSAYMLEKLGYSNISPRYDEPRTDIIQTLELKTKDNLVNFTQGIQQTSPIDSFVQVLPAPMPGYPFDEVMAAGSFTQGSTIELSADAPVIEPYTLYIQGGLTFEYGKLSILLALSNMKGKLD